MRVTFAVIFMMIACGLAATALGPVFETVSVANSSTNISEYPMLAESFNMGPLIAWLMIPAGLFYLIWHHIVGPKVTGRPAR